jgi:glycosyltransferase involved in cell wall biosynthesis
MKVAVVFYEMTAESGGAFTFQSSLLEALDQLAGQTRHEFALWSTGRSTGPGDRFRRIPNHPGAVLRERVRELVRDVQDARLGTRKIQATSAFDHALAQDGTELVWFATNYAQDCDLPYIFTIWDVEYMRQPWFPEVSRGGEWESRDRYYSRWLAKATRVVVPNAAGTEQLLRYYRIDRERILEIHHPAPGLDRTAGSPDRDPELLEQLGVKPPYIFYPAQFWPHKNHTRILESLVRLPDTHAVFVGADKGGGLTHVRGLAAELGVAERVVFPGFVEADQLIALYRGADALVYPSLFGPENLPPLEAFELGCPVIAAAVPGAEEQLGDAALLVEPYDSAAYVAAIESLADPSLREQLVARGHERVKSFSADAYVRRVVDFLDDFGQVRRLWA